ncbi:SEC-C metal-binding domain-containing protein [Colwellia sp. 20A7]
MGRNDPCPCGRDKKCRLR